MSEKIIVQVDQEIQDLVPTFLSNRQRDLISLRDALESGDYARLRGIGHNLKGVGGGYGFHAITEIGGEIERAAKTEHRDEIEQLVQRYQDYLERVEVEFV